MRNCLLFLLVVLAVATWATETTPPSGLQVEDEQTSPRGGFKIVNYRKSPGSWMDPGEIWLLAIRPEFKTQRLLTYDNRASCFMDADERHIAINHHQDSGTDLVYLFTLDKNNHFQRADVELRSAAVKAMVTMFRPESTPEFDHLGCSSVRWLPGGRLLGMLWGYNSFGLSSAAHDYRLSAWFFVYDVERKAFVWELSLKDVNQNALSRMPAQRTRAGSHTP